MSAALCLAALSPAWAFQYVNGRFGYSVEIPDGFSALPAPENGDGNAFASKPLGGTISVWGSHNALDSTLEEDMKQEMEGKKIAYRRAKDHWYVLSWLDEQGHIAYKKKILKDGIFYGILFVYPQKSKKPYDSVIKTVVDSLHID